MPSEQVRTVTDGGRTAWQAWVDDALQGGAKKAHAWVKGRQGSQQVQLVPSIKGGLTSCPVALQMAQHAKWKGVWEEEPAFQTLAADPIMR